MVVAQRVEMGSLAGRCWSAAGNTGVICAVAGAVAMGEIETLSYRVGPGLERSHKAIAGEEREDKRLG